MSLYLAQEEDTSYSLCRCISVLTSHPCSHLTFDPLELVDPVRRLDDLLPHQLREVRGVEEDAEKVAPALW